MTKVNPATVKNKAEVAELLARGVSHERIATALGIGVRTVFRSSGG